MKQRVLDNFVTLKRKKTSEDTKNEKPEEEKIVRKKPQNENQKLENKINLPKETIENHPSNLPKETIENSPSKFYPTYSSFIETLETWKDPLKDYILEPNNKNMLYTYNFLKKEYENKIIFPPKENIFKAFQITKYSEIKVVIIGQDPYPNPGDAMGLSFSVNKSQRIPQSLLNIYKCLEKDNNIQFKKPLHGDLTSWAEQGVFLLNSTLTVECKKANSHQKNSKWNLFTDFVISKISSLKKNIVFLLWGNFAIEKKKLIDGKKHLIITNIHPSPLAQKKGDFTISKQFSECNEYLKKNGIKEINWQIQ